MVNWLFPFLKFLFSSDKKLCIRIKNIFGFYPNNIHLYKLAFRHSSVSVDTIKGLRKSNERLEYLGDAVLSLVIADFLFKKFPYHDEGFLTDIRSRLVSRKNLNKLSVKLGIDKMVNLDSSSNNVYRSVAGDTFEAIVGAIYLDRGFIFTKSVLIERIFNLHINIDEVLLNDTNFKSKVIDWAQREKKTHEFIVTGELGSGFQHQYVVELMMNGDSLGKGYGHSIKTAEQSAAQNACKQLGLIE